LGDWFLFLVVQILFKQLAKDGSSRVKGERLKKGQRSKVKGEREKQTTDDG